jgi:hypothetical protein
MKPVMNRCFTCELLFVCNYNEFDRCPRVDAATKGLGIPTTPKKVESYIANVPFGVYMGLKHVMAKREKELAEIERLKSRVRHIAKSEYKINTMGMDTDGDVVYGGNK